MEPIHVPRPPKEAFNRNRPVSDLIRHQVEHFRHLEHRLSPELRQTLPQQRVLTEADAARYIAAMTRLLKSQAPTAATPRPAPAVMPAPAPAAPAQGLDLAASAAKKKPAKKGKKG